MTASTLIKQFILDYLAVFIICGVIIVGLIVANIVVAIKGKKKKKSNAVENSHPNDEQKVSL